MLIETPNYKVIDVELDGINDAAILQDKINETIALGYEYVKSTQATNPKFMILEFKKVQSNEKELLYD